MNPDRVFKPGDLLNMMPDLKMGYGHEESEYSLGVVYTGPSYFNGWVEVYRPDHERVVAVPLYRIQQWMNWTVGQ
jgi:hypothetical protein